MITEEYTTLEKKNRTNTPYWYFVWELTRDLAVVGISVATLVVLLEMRGSINSLSAELTKIVGKFNLSETSTCLSKICRIVGG